MEAARQLAGDSDERHVLRSTDAKIVTLALANKTAQPLERIAGLQDD